MANNGPRDMPSCQFNKAITCETWLTELALKKTTKCCEHCGWNPAEWAERVCKLKGVKDG